MGKESLQEFLGEWRVYPLYTYRSGFRRTWIVRSKQEPTEKLLQHDFGLAVINDAAPRTNPLSTERLQTFRPDRNSHASAKRFRQGPSHVPKSWVGVVVGDSVPATALPTGHRKNVGVVGAAAAVQSQAAAAIPRAPVLEQPQPVTGSPPAWNPANIMEMLGTAIEAALKPLRGQLEATIVPMQKTIESLQAEFVAIRELAAAGDDDMSDAAASEMALALRDPKRGTDTDRVQTRATRLRLTASGS